MTYVPHILITASGPLYTTEQWSCSWRMVIGWDGGPYPSAGALKGFAEANLEDIAADISAWFTAPGAKIGAAAKLQTVKVNPIGADGAYSDPSSTIRKDYTGTLPVGAAASWPAQCTVAVSTLTEIERGPGHRGRWYPPTGACNMTATGRISSADALGMATAAQTLLNNLNNRPGLDVDNPRIAVVSKVGAPGPVYHVTQVAVGDVVDTQRRRREDLPEVYQTLAVTIT